MKKICCALVLVACLLFLFRAQGATGLSSRGRGRYEKAVQFIKRSQYDFALLEFRAIIREFPESRYAQASLFGIGEYFYNQKLYYEAMRNFTRYIETYPESDGAIFARAYLLTSRA